MPNRQPDAALRLVDVLRGSRMQIQSAEYPAGSLARFSTTYSPFIDGLRAISIVAVVGFHVGLPGFSGGFVGVDVFFVISGFLIINQIIAGLERGTFSLRDFWARRALRILPPLALVLAASILISSTALIFPRDIRDFGESVLYATAMAANHFFYDQQGYFDTGSDLKPRSIPGRSLSRNNSTLSRRYCCLPWLGSKRPQNYAGSRCESQSWCFWPR
jgi:hypothetical protein